MIRAKVLAPTSVTDIFLTSKRGKPIYIAILQQKVAKNLWSQSVHCRLKGSTIPPYLDYFDKFGDQVKTTKQSIQI